MTVCNYILSRGRRKRRGRFSRTCRTRTVPVRGSGITPSAVSIPLLR